MHCNVCNKYRKSKKAKMQYIYIYIKSLRKRGQEYEKNI